MLEIALGYRDVYAEARMPKLWDIRIVMIQLQSRMTEHSRMSAQAGYGHLYFLEYGTFLRFCEEIYFLNRIIYL